MITVTKYYCEGCSWSYDAAADAMECEAQTDCLVRCEDYSLGHRDFKHYPFKYADSLKFIEPIIKAAFPDSAVVLVINIDPECGAKAIQVNYYTDLHTRKAECSMRESIRNLPEPNNGVHCHHGYNHNFGNLPWRE